jgi:hypothetical protein
MQSSHQLKRKRVADDTKAKTPKQNKRTDCVCVCQFHPMVISGTQIAFQRHFIIYGLIDDISIAVEVCELDAHPHRGGPLGRAPRHTKRNRHDDAFRWDPCKIQRPRSEKRNAGWVIERASNAAVADGEPVHVAGDDLACPIVSHIEGAATQGDPIRIKKRSSSPPRFYASRELTSIHLAGNDAIGNGLVVGNIGILHGGGGVGEGDAKRVNQVGPLCGLISVNEKESKQSLAAA